MLSRTSAFTKLLVFLLAGFFFLHTLPALAEFTPDNAAKTDPLLSQKGMQGVSVGEFTGAALYHYPLNVPAGRNGLTPQLSLTYNSQDEAPDNLVGYHWSLTSYSIRRLNKKGVEKLYDEHDFTATLPFESGELTGVNLTDGMHGLYAQRVESQFATYEFLPDNTWQVTDRKGNRYLFGVTDDGRSSDPSDDLRTAEWMLEEVRDPNDNFIHFFYQTIDNRIYPDTIVYTGHGDDEGMFKIKFLIDSSVRPDSYFSYATGFRVDTNHLMSGIDVYVNDMLRHHYTFSYTSMSPLVRQTIGNITETGYDSYGQATSLPPTTFDYSASSVGWQETTDYLPEWIFEDCNAGSGSCDTPNVYSWDMNDDGLIDFEYTTDNVKFHRAVNDGKGGWTKIPPLLMTTSSSVYVPTIFTKPLDFNGDLKTEIVTDYGYPLLDVSLSNPQNPAKLDNGASVADLNGDGLPDLIQKRSVFMGKGGNKIESSTCLNDTGHGCFSTDLWESPEVLITDTEFYQYPRTAYVQDCNYDGLADVRFSGSGPRNWINDGKGEWVLNPSGTCHFSQLDSLTRRSEDFNGDGLIDTLIAEKTILPVGQMITNEIALGIGNGTMSAPIKNKFPMVLGTFGNGFNNDDGVRFLDLNGDKLPDIMQSKKHYDGKGNTTFTKKVYMNTGSRPYFLKTVHHSGGSTITLDYKTSAQYLKSDGTQANPALPVIVDTVSRMTMNDGMGNVTETNYFYEGGHYYFEHSYERSFAGFHIVTRTDGLGIVSKTYYHQDHYAADDSAHGKYQDHVSKKGLVYRTEHYNDHGQLLTTSINRFDHTALGPDHVYPFLTQTLQQTFDGGIPKATASSFVYDDFGNLIQTIDFGEVISGGNDGSFSDAGNDLLKTITDFIDQTGYAYQTKTFDQSGALLTHARIYYDNLGLGQVQQGNVTTQENWLDQPAGWITSHIGYDEYGMPTSSVNPRGFSTQTSYDDDHLYPSLITNPKGQIIQMTYDPATGQVLSSTDPNGLTTEITYDGLGRQISLVVNGKLMSTTHYNDQVQLRSVHTIAYNDGEQVDSYLYLDGLGRTIESKQEAPQGQWVTTQTLYNKRGQVEKALQPYFSSTSDFEPLTTQKPGTSFTYDAMGRVLTTTTSVGSTVTAFEGWKVTLTDAEGNQKVMTRDARGNLIQMNESNDGQIYQTGFTYDPLGHLSQIRDDQNNLTKFAYDSLGRRTFQSVPGGDGGWFYSYDPNGNMISQADPKNQTLNFTYDELDRMLSDGDSAFLYDQGDYSIGRLSGITKNGYNHHLTYDHFGRLIAEQKTIGEKIFDFAYTYDQLGSLSSLMYPDGTLVRYQYDDAHYLNHVSTEDSQLFASDFTYAPTSKITRMTLGNGITLTNTYDPNQLYRLTQKTASSGLQDYAYSYDAVGNVLTLSDAAAGKTAKMVAYQYDDLYRLTRADYTQTTTQADLSQSYQYDSIGNMTYKSDVGDFTYNDLHPHAVMSAGTHNFDYDPNGNMIVRDGESVIYDPRDRLIQVGQKAVFAYSEGTDRVSKTDIATGQTTYYPNRYFELHPDKEVIYIYAQDLRIATIETEIKIDPPATESENTDDQNDASDSGETNNNDQGGGPSSDDTSVPSPNPTPSTAPMPSLTTPDTNAETPSVGGGGGYGSQNNLALMKLIGGGKKDEAFSISKKIYLYGLNAIQEAGKNVLKAGLLPVSVFPNLAITYDSDKAVITWDAMPSDVSLFRLYRSKGNHAGPQEATSVGLPDLTAKKTGNQFVHTFDKPNARYAYRVEALDKKGRVLAQSITLHSRQIFIESGTSKVVDFVSFSDSDFSHVQIKRNEFVTTQETKSAQALLFTPTDQLGAGARLQANFLSCSYKADGARICKKTDEQWIEVYVVKAPPAKKITR